MANNLFMKFIENLLNIRMFSFTSKTSSLTFFEGECCFEPTIQPLYTADGLRAIIENLDDQIFYEITDSLGTCSLLFRFEDEVYSVGPYVKETFSKTEMQELLVTHHLPASVLLSLKMYYEAFPKLSYYMIRNTVTAAMRTFVPNIPMYDYRQLQSEQKELKKEAILTESTMTYAQTIQQYEMENFFLRKITEGDVAGVKLAFETIVTHFFVNNNKSKQVLYSTNSNGFAIVRTLARKAAEQGGAPVIRIDEITQESIQRYNSASTANEMEAVEKNMLLELTKAVAESKAALNYSPVIRNVLGYILASYSNDVSVAALARKFQISEGHLSRLFKKETGETISDYLTMVRTKKAAELLSGTTLPIAEIAEYVGYADSNYFVKRFRKTYGITPSEYRRNKL